MKTTNVDYVAEFRWPNSPPGEWQEQAVRGTLEEAKAALCDPATCDHSSRVRKVVTTTNSTFEVVFMRAAKKGRRQKAARLKAAKK